MKTPRGREGVGVPRSRDPGLGIRVEGGSSTATAQRHLGGRKSFLSVRLRNLPSPSCPRDFVGIPPSFALRSAAFTLVELLTAVAILALLALLLFFITNSVTRTWRSEMARMDAYANGRAVLDFMGNELKKAWVEQASDSKGSWNGIPAGTEFNWRNVYCNFHTNLAYQCPNNSPTTPVPLYSIAVPSRKGTALWAVGYGLSNGFLVRWATNNADVVLGANGVTNGNWCATNTAVGTADILADNMAMQKVAEKAGFKLTREFGEPVVTARLELV